MPSMAWDAGDAPFLAVSLHAFLHTVALALPLLKPVPCPCHHLRPAVPCPALLCVCHCVPTQAHPV
jgi:hypothetical protein